MDYIPSDNNFKKYENNSSDYIHSVVHYFLFLMLVILLCLIAIANNRIVPGQCAEYCASLVLSINPKPTEYNNAANAINTEY